MSNKYITYKQYYSPTQVTVFLNDYILADACIIAYNIQDEKIPVFGYNDYNYRTVYRGQTLVRGNLAIKFTQQGHLFSVMEQWEQDALYHLYVDVDTALKHTGPKALYENVKNLTADDREKLEDAIASARPGSYEQKRLIDELRRLFWKQQSYFAEANQTRSAIDESVNVAMRLAATGKRAGLANTSTNKISIVFGGPEQFGNTSLTKTIHGVYFDQEAMTITSQVPNDGESIMEVYQFIGRNITSGSRTRSFK